MTDRSRAEHQDFFAAGQKPRPRKDWATTRAVPAMPEGREPDIIFRPAAPEQKGDRDDG